MFSRKFGVVSCLVLGACSSGGSGSVSGTPQTPQPPITPPAATTLASQPVGASNALAAHNGIEAFTVDTTSLSGVVTANVMSSPTGQVVKTTSGFVFTLPNGDQAIIDTTAASTQRISPNLYLATIVPNSTLVMFRQGAALTYSTFGIWDERGISFSSRSASSTAVSVRGTTFSGAIAYGLKTEQMPVSGSATFTGSALGVYTLGSFGGGSFSSDNVRLVADFQTGRVAGAITNLTVFGGPSRMNDLYLSAGLISGAGFTGTATAGNNASDQFSDFAGSTGTFTGQFNGPNAAEASGTFLMTNDPNRLRLTGSFAATGQTTPAGQPTPAAPTLPTTLAAAPAGTTFALNNRYGIEALDIRNNPTQAAGATGASFAANASGTIAIASNGFTLTVYDKTMGFANTDSRAGPNGTTLFTTSDPTLGNAQGRFLAGPRLTYAAYGSWDQLASPLMVGLPGTARYAINGGVVAYGLRNGVTPTTGSATYTGGVVGLYFLPGDSGAITGGTSRLVADFSRVGSAGNTVVAGAFTNLTGQSGITTDTRSLSDIYVTSGLPSGTTFNGRTTGGANVAAADLSTATGTINGAFYGPNGAEIAGTFNLSDIGLGITIVGAFGGTGQMTPAGQPLPSVPAPPVIDPNATLAGLPAGISFAGTDLNALALPVPVLSGPTNGVGILAVTQTASGRTFQLYGADGYATLGAATKTDLGYFGPVKNAAGATTGMVHVVENPLTYSNYGVWAYSTTATSAAVPPALEAGTSWAGVFAYGNPTVAASMPTSGTATYSGGLAGHFSTEPTGLGTITSGVLTMNVDFARNVASGGITNILAVRPGAAPGAVDRLNDVSLKQAGFNGANLFYGSAIALPTPGVTIDLGGPAGDYSARFFGPGAAEIGGSFYLTDGHNFMQAAFAGRK